MLQLADRSSVLVSAFGDKSSFKPVKCVLVGVGVWLSVTIAMGLFVPHQSCRRMRANAIKI